MNDVNDIYFNIKDVAYIVGFVVTALTSYLTLKGSLKSLQERLKLKELAFNKELNDLKENIIMVKSGKKAMKMEFKETIKENGVIFHTRIDKTQNDFKQYIEKADSEFKDINSSMNNVLQSTSEIKGMIKTLLDKR